MEFDRELLIQKLVAGDKDAYTFLFKTYYKNLCTYSYKFIRNFDVAEEIVQEVFFKIWEKRSNLNLPENIESYLYRAVHNESINYCKKNQKETINRNLYGVSISAFENFSDVLIQKELNNKIQFAIADLPEKCQEVFKMNRYNAMTYKEISRKLGITEKGVEFHMLRALKILREKLKEYLVYTILLLSIFIY